jgi:hypothetical protein
MWRWPMLTAGQRRGVTQCCFNCETGLVSHVFICKNRRNLGRRKLTGMKTKDNDPGGSVCSIWRTILLWVLFFYSLFFAESFPGHQCRTILKESYFYSEYRFRSWFFSSLSILLSKSFTNPVFRSIRAWFIYWFIYRKSTPIYWIDFANLISPTWVWVW